MRKLVFLILLTLCNFKVNGAQIPCILRSAEVCSTSEGFKDALDAGCAGENTNCLKRFCNQNCTISKECPFGNCTLSCPDTEVKDLCRKNCTTFALTDSTFKGKYCFSDDLSSGYLDQLGKEKSEELRKNSIRKTFETQLKEFERHLRRSEELRAILIARGAGEFVKEIEQENELLASRQKLEQENALLTLKAKSSKISAQAPEVKEVGSTEEVTSQPAITNEATEGANETATNDARVDRKFAKKAAKAAKIKAKESAVITVPQEAVAQSPATSADTEAK